MWRAQAEGSGAFGAFSVLETSHQKLRVDTKGGSCHRTKIQLFLVKLALSFGLCVGRGRVVADSSPGLSSLKNAFCIVLVLLP